MNPTRHRASTWNCTSAAALALILTSVAHGQAWVELDTPTTRLITNEINGALIGGDIYSAEVLHGPATALDADLVAVTPLFVPSGGRINALRRGTLGTYKVGEQIRFKVRAWLNEGGRYPRYQDARVRGSSASWLSEPVKAVEGDPVPLTIKLDGMPLFSLNTVVDPASIGRAIVPVGPSLPSSFGSGGNVTFHGLTGDGRAAFYRVDTFAGLPAGYATSVAHVLSTQLYEDLRTFARQDSFIPFPDPNFPTEPTITPAWTVPGMTSDGSLAIGNRTSGSVSNVFLIRDSDLIPLPLHSALGLSGDGTWAFGTLPDGTVVRHGMRSGTNQQIAPRPASGFSPRVHAVSESGDACLLGFGSVLSERRHYWSRQTGFVEFPPTNQFNPVRLSPDGRVLGGQWRTNNHSIAAIWTLAKGLERIGPLDRESAIGGVSFDGSILAGETWLLADPANTEPTVWVRTGTKIATHRLRDLVPEFAVGSIDARNVFGLSHDGRSVGIHNGTFGHLFHFPLPGENFSINHRRPVGTGMPSIGFHGQRGVGYTLEEWRADGSWAVVKPEFEVLDTWYSWPVPETGAQGLFRINARPLRQ